MIGSLRGKVTLRDGNYILVEVGGVGYRVLVPSNVVASLGSDLSIFTYTHVKEDALELFGFGQSADLKLFENLISVSGVGPKTAMAIFSYSDRSSIVRAVLEGDVDFFTKVPRLGKKNAQKVIIELKNKLGDDSTLDLSEPESKENDEILAALESFGFSAKEAKDGLKNVSKSAKSSQEKIKQALKYLGK